MLRARLDLVRIPILLVDEPGRLLHANRAADALLKDGDTLRLTHGRLTATTQCDTDTLRRLLRADVPVAEERTCSFWPGMAG